MSFPQKNTFRILGLIKGNYANLRIRVNKQEPRGQTWVAVHFFFKQCVNGTEPQPFI